MNGWKLNSWKLNKVLIVGCGDLGATVAVQLSQLGLETIGLKRNLMNIHGVDIIQADVTRPETLISLSEIQPDILIYCVAANGQTDEQYKAQYVDGLRNVLTTQQQNTQLKHVFFVSSTRVYGQATDELLSEADIAMPADFGGKRLLEAENLLKEFCLGNLPRKSPDKLQGNFVGHTVLRLSGIYGPGRLRMINLAKTPENWPVQNSWTNRIHRDDAAAFVVFLVKQVLADVPVEPCYIVTDSMPVSQYEVLVWIAERLHLETPYKPSNHPSNTPDVKGGKRLCNQALLASGFHLQYPDFKTGYQTLLESVSI